MVLVSPYVKLGKLRDLARRIQSALSRNVAVSLILRKPDVSTSRFDSADQEQVMALRRRGLKLFVVPDLHAKLYLSESAALVTSLNLLESSFNNSIELGLYLPCSDPEYGQLCDFLRDHIKPVCEQVASFEMPAPTAPSVRQRRAAPQANRAEVQQEEVEEFDEDDAWEDDEDDDLGHCIGCAEEIDLDRERPFCRDCYRDWSGDEGERQAHCHGCGKSYRSATFDRPLCTPCYEEIDF